MDPIWENPYFAWGHFWRRGYYHRTCQNFSTWSSLATHVCWKGFRRACRHSVVTGVGKYRRIQWQLYGSRFLFLQTCSEEQAQFFTRARLSSLCSMGSQWINRSTMFIKLRPSFEGRQWSSTIFQIVMHVLWLFWWRARLNLTVLLLLEAPKTPAHFARKTPLTN